MSNTCNFSPRGNSKSECVNTCRTENVGDCLSFCNNICDSLGMDSSAGTVDALTAKYEDLSNQLKMYQASEGQMYNSNQLGNNSSRSGLSVESLNQISDLNVRRDIMWKYLLSTYNINKMLLSSSNASLEKSYEVNETQDNMKQKLELDMKKINNANTTSKSIVEANNYAYQKTLNEIKVFKVILIVVAINFIFPLLVAPSWSPFTKIGSIVFWSIVMIGVSIYAMIELLYKQRGRDDKKFNEKNFGKPTAKNILNSKRDAGIEIDSKHGNLDFDPQTINIGDIDRYKSAEGSCNVDVNTGNNEHSNNTNSNNNSGNRMNNNMNTNTGNNTNRMNNNMANNTNNMNNTGNNTNNMNNTGNNMRNGMNSNTSN